MIAILMGCLFVAQAPAAIDTEDADHLTPLMRASARGDLKAVVALLDKGANPNARSTDTNVTPLMFAAHFGHTAVIKALLAKGARIELKDTTGAGAVDWAAVGGHDELESMLTGPNVSLNPFLNMGLLPLALMDKAAGKSP
jgi:serine/threonine-protein phosphatase 6 regulatory ankyrin repeat subunit B